FLARRPAAHEEAGAGSNAGGEYLPACERPVERGCGHRLPRLPLRRLVMSMGEWPLAAMRMIRVVIAEDDLLVREGIARLLERPPFEVVGLAGEAVELMGLVREQVPDLAVLDIRMPPSHTTEGLDAAQAIRSEFPDIGILVLSAHVEVHRAIDLLAEGRG